MENSSRAWAFLLILVFQLLVGSCRPLSPTLQPAATGATSDQVSQTAQPPVDKNTTLASLKKVSDFPFYTMRYEGDYGFGEYLQGLKQKLSLFDTHLPCYQMTQM